MDYVYIADFNEKDRDCLLEALWNSTIIKESESIFDIEVAKEQISKNDGFADCICGRHILVYIYLGDNIDPYLYDRENGIGSVQEIVDNIRINKKNNCDILLGLNILNI